MHGYKWPINWTRTRTDGGWKPRWLELVETVHKCPKVAQVGPSAGRIRGWANNGTPLRELIPSDGAFRFS